MKIIIGILFLFTVLVHAEKSDGRYLRLLHEYQMDNQGKITYHHRHQLRLDSYYAVNNLFGETFVIFDTTMQSLQVHKSETIMRDGKIVPSPGNAFNMVLPRMAHKAPAYNRFREMVITHTGLEVGAVIDLDYSLTTETGFLPGFSKMINLQQDVPVDTLTIRIHIPENESFEYHLQGSQGKPLTSISGPLKTYEWNFYNIPASVNEPQKDDPGPRLFVSTYSDYREPLGALFDVQTETSFPDEESAAFFEEAVRDAGTELEKSLIVQEIIATQVFTIPIEPYWTGYRFRTPSEVWQAAAGTPLEKALLLRAVLGSLGIDSEISLAADAVPDVSDMVINPEIFDEPLVRARIDGYGTAYFTTDKTLTRPVKYDLLHKHLLEPADGGLSLHSLQVSELHDNTSSWKADITLSGSEAVGSMGGRFTGVFNPHYKLVADEENLQGYMRSNVKHMNITGSTIRKRDASILEADLTFSRSLPDFSEKQTVFSLPVPSDGMSLLYDGSVSLNRRTDLLLPFPLKEHFEYSIEKPANWQLLTGSLEKEVKSSSGRVSVSIQQKGNRIKIRRQLEITDTLITPEEYEGFLELWRLWRTPEYNRITFIHGL